MRDANSQLIPRRRKKETLIPPKLLMLFKKLCLIFLTLMCMEGQDCRTLKMKPLSYQLCTKVSAYHSNKDTGGITRFGRKIYIFGCSYFITQQDQYRNDLSSNRHNGNQTMQSKEQYLKLLKNQYLRKSRIGLKCVKETKK